MKNSNFKKKAGLVAALVSSYMYPQDLSAVASSLQSQTQNVTSITKTITDWVIGLFALVALIRLILIFTSQGSGEDKISKAGTWIFMLVFCVIGYMLSKFLLK